MYIIGQMFGFLAVILGFISFQMKTRKNLMIVQTSLALSFSVHYLIIGGLTGCVLNLVCAVRNFAFSREKGSKWLTIIFAVIMVIMGAVSWQGWYTLFFVVGITINTFGLSFKNPQNIRRSTLVTSPLLIIYDVVVKSYGGIMLETIIIISSIIGLIRYRKTETEK